MEIKGINPGSLYLEDKKNQKTVKPSEEIKKDTIEISTEGKNLIKKNDSVSKMTEIQDKIKSNFYNSDEVISKVAERILKDLE